MRVLIADDDLITRLTLAATVSALGHEVLEAGDGEDAWERHLAEHPDVLITDRMMPRLEGVELLRRIRAAESGERYTYVILATARTGRDEVLEGIDAGADDYLVKPVDPFDLEVRLATAARVCGLHRQLAEAAQELRRINDELAATARTDGLTGVGNRRRFDEDIAALHATMARAGSVYTIGIVDVDHFKGFNDRHGHLAGDDALRAIGHVLRTTCRQGDGVYRYGGEEFVVVFPEAALPPVILAAERVRQAVESAEASPRVPGGGVTISIGMATFDRTRHHSAVDVIEEADAALYAAKDGGRNRIVVVPSAPAAEPA